MPDLLDDIDSILDGGFDQPTQRANRPSSPRAPIPRRTAQARPFVPPVRISNPSSQHSPSDRELDAFDRELLSGRLAFNASAVTSHVPAHGISSSQSQHFGGSGGASGFMARSTAPALLPTVHGRHARGGSQAPLASQALHNSQVSQTPQALQVPRTPPRRKNSNGLSKFAYQPRGNPATPQVSDIDSSSPAIPSSPILMSQQRHENPFRTPDKPPQGFKPRLTALQTNYQPKQNERQGTIERPRPAERIAPEAGLFTPQEVQTPATPSVPTVRGIPLVPVSRLPDRFRSVFAYPLFNAVQSRCFESVYNSNDNIVVSAPTGSGKTAIMELAICALFKELEQGTYKVVYQAPTKALCSERKKDWEKKFCNLGLVCTELTGDTDNAQLSNVRNGDLIVTTPEKWDSMTRRWQDHRKLLDMVRLFLIDEVHILKESRGATLEVVVSRMRSIGSNVRFVALSATVPNARDICAWLGKDATAPNILARLEIFGPEFRPVQLQKHVYGYQWPGNDFQFDRVLDKHLPQIVQKHSGGHPAMVFCMTRAICISTSKLLAEAWRKWSDSQRPWRAPQRTFSFQNKDLQATAECGVAFHHAGLDQGDRSLVENLYLEGQINVICCTSTLAVGVNLPAHLVVLKNTVGYGDKGPQEYVDMEVMQMLGRAGRPQFNDSGVAVIMTAQNKKQKYENMDAGKEMVESSLHENLVEHMNAEIGLSTITSMETAKSWLKSTFLYIRLQKNPLYYKLEGQTPQKNKNSEQRLDDICEREVDILQVEGMVTENYGRLSLTKFGEAMAKYYIKLGTMRHIIKMRPKSTLPEILTALSEAEEFKDLRLRMGEKGLYKELNKDGAMKFPIKEDVNTAAHKVSILIQFELGMMEMPMDQTFQKLKSNVTQDKAQVFKHCNRIVRCIIDCQQSLGDSVIVLNALQLSRCLEGKAWENSAIELRQIEGIGPASIKKLVNANVKSLQKLAEKGSTEIERILSRNPPFGTKILKSVNSVPQFQLSAIQVGKPSKNSETKLPEVKVQATLKITNKETVPRRFKGMELTIIFVAERSDGLLIHLERQFTSQLADGKTFKFSAQLKSPDQALLFHVACEQIAGTWSSSELKPNVEESMFPKDLPKPLPSRPPAQKANNPSNSQFKQPLPQKTLAPSGKPQPFINEPDDEDYGDDSIFDDIDFFHDIDDFKKPPSRKNTGGMGRPSYSLNHNSAPMEGSQPIRTPTAQSIHEQEEDDEAEQLPNGKWKCRHKCGDRTKCKHLCCREGLDKPPKPQKKKFGPTQLESTAKQASIQRKNEPKESTSSPVHLDLARVEACVTKPRLKATPLLKRPGPTALERKVLGDKVLDVIDMSSDSGAISETTKRRPTWDTDISRIRSSSGSYTGNTMNSARPRPSFTPVNTIPDEDDDDVPLPQDIFKRRYERMSPMAAGIERVEEAPAAKRVRRELDISSSPKETPKPMEITWSSTNDIPTEDFFSASEFMVMEPAAMETNNHKDDNDIWKDLDSGEPVLPGPAVNKPEPIFSTEDKEPPFFLGGASDFSSDLQGWNSDPPPVCSTAPTSIAGSNFGKETKLDSKNDEAMAAIRLSQEVNNSERVTATTAEDIDSIRAWLGWDFEYADEL